MTVAASGAKPRLLFLDNLRYLIVLFVLFFHVSAGYSGWPEYYQETQSGGFFGDLRGFIGPIPRMPILFFVAGFFVLPSLKGRGSGGFLWSKVQRLGYPWLVCVLFLGPLMPFLGYYSQSFYGLSSASYWDFWTMFLKSGVDKLLSPIAFVPNPQFHHMHYWFTSVLLQFCVVLTLGYAAWKKWGPNAVDPSRRPASMTKVFICTCLGIALLKTLFINLDTPHGVLAFFFQFSPVSFATYGGFFALGIYAQTRGWFVDDQVPGWRVFGWLFAWLVLFGAASAALYNFGQEWVPQPLMMLMGTFSEALMGMLFLVMALGLTHRYMNRPSERNAKFAANSYYVYLIHYPIILLLRLPLLRWDVPTGVKFVLVLVAAAVISYVISEYFIRRHTRLSVVTLVGIHVVLLAFGLPRTSFSHQLLDRQDQLKSAVAPEKAVAVTEALPDDLDIWSMATPKARLSWQAGTLYFSYGADGLNAVGADGVKQVLNSAAKFGAIAPLLGGGLVAVDLETNQLVQLDGTGQVKATLVDSAAGVGVPQYLAVDGRGGFYFSAEAARNRAGAEDAGEGDEDIEKGTEGKVVEGGEKADSLDGPALEGQGDAGGKDSDRGRRGLLPQSQRSSAARVD